MALTYVKIASATVGSGGASSIDFNTIPTTYDDLVIKISARTNRSDFIADPILVRFNGNSSNYQSRIVYGDGSSATSTSTTTAGGATFQYAVSNTSTASTFSNTEIYIPNFRASTNKSLSADSAVENNGTSSFLALTASLWSNTAAITSIAMTPVIGTLFLQHSTAVLYGISRT